MRTKQKQSYVIARALAVIDNDPVDSAMTQVTLARDVHLHPNYFSAIFKVEAGVSFRTYRLTCIMKRAKELLTQTTNSIAAIAENWDIKTI